MLAAYPLVRNFSAFSTRKGVRTNPSRFGSSPSCTSSCRMRSSICVLYIALFLLPTLAHAAQATPASAADADALYRERANIAKAHEAAAIWDARVKANPKDFESLWKISRAMYWIGGHDAPDDRRMALERGVESGRQAAALEPNRPEGHFWMAAHMGALAGEF